MVSRRWPYYQGDYQSRVVDILAHDTPNIPLYEIPQLFDLIETTASHPNFTDYYSHPDNFFILLKFLTICHDATFINNSQFETAFPEFKERIKNVVQATISMAIIIQPHTGVGPFGIAGSYKNKNYVHQHTSGQIMEGILTIHIIPERETKDFEEESVHIHEAYHGSIDNQGESVAIVDNELGAQTVDAAYKMVMGNPQQVLDQIYTADWTYTINLLSQEDQVASMVEEANLPGTSREQKLKALVAYMYLRFNQMSAGSFHIYTAERASAQLEKDNFDKINWLADEFRIAYTQYQTGTLGFVTLEAILGDEVINDNSQVTETPDDFLLKCDANLINEIATFLTNSPHLPYPDFESSQEAIKQIIYSLYLVVVEEDLDAAITYFEKQVIPIIEVAASEQMDTVINYKE